MTKEVNPMAKGDDLDERLVNLAVGVVNLSPKLILHTAG